MPKNKFLLDILGISIKDAAKYPQVAQSWESVTSWDDVVIPQEKFVIDRILQRRQKNAPQCPFLGKRGNYFYFCKARTGEGIDLKPYPSAPTFNSPEYQAKVGHFELQLWCMQPEEDHKKCLLFQQAQKSH